MQGREPPVKDVSPTLNFEGSEEGADVIVDLWRRATRRFLQTGSTGFNYQAGASSRRCFLTPINPAATSNSRGRAYAPGAIAC